MLACLSVLIGTLPFLKQFQPAGTEVARGMTACPGSWRRCINRSNAAGEGGKQGLVQLKPSEEDLGSSKLKSFDVSGSGPARGWVARAGKRDAGAFYCGLEPRRSAQGALQTPLTSNKVAT